MLKKLKSYSSGFVLACLIAGAAFLLSPYLGIASTFLAVTGGIALSFMYDQFGLKPGIDWSASFVLRFGIAFLGFRIVFDDILALGWPVFLMVALAIICTVTVGVLAARLLGLRQKFGALVGGAVAICGASAATAITSILPDYKDKDRDLSLTIICVTALSTIAMVTYPLIGTAVGLSPSDMGVFLGGTIHDVGQSAGAGYALSEEIGDMAVLTKMIRVAAILPVLLGLMLVFKTAGTRQKGKLRLPIFLFVFIGFVTLNSMLTIPVSLSAVMGEMSKAALVIALAAIGLKTNLQEILAVGPKPVMLIALQTLCMMTIILSCIVFL